MVAHTSVGKIFTIRVSSMPNANRRKLTGVNQAVNGHLGLPRDVAKDLAINSIYGAGAMMQETGEEPSQLRANVSSPAGTTIAAIRELEESGLRGAFYRATKACADRSAELGK